MITVENIRMMFFWIVISLTYGCQGLATDNTIMCIFNCSPSTIWQHLYSECDVLNSDATQWSFCINIIFGILKLTRGGVKEKLLVWERKGFETLLLLRF